MHILLCRDKDWHCVQWLPLWWCPTAELLQLQFLAPTHTHMPLAQCIIAAAPHTLAPCRAQVVGSMENSASVWVWDWATGSLAGLLTGHTGVISDVSTSPGLPHLVAAGSRECATPAECWLTALIAPRWLLALLHLSANHLPEPCSLAHLCLIRLVL